MQPGAMRNNSVQLPGCMLHRPCTVGSGVLGSPHYAGSTAPQDTTTTPSPPCTGNASSMCSPLPPGKLHVGQVSPKAPLDWQHQWFVSAPDSPLLYGSGKWLQGPRAACQPLTGPQLDRSGLVYLCFTPLYRMKSKLPACRSQAYTANVNGESSVAEGTIAVCF